MRSPEDYSRIKQQVAEMIDDNILHEQHARHILDLSGEKLKHLPIAPVLRAIEESKHNGDLEHLWLNDNQLFGSMKWNVLPARLQTLRIEGNKVSGRIDWENLPSSLTTIVVTRHMATASLFDAPGRWQLVRDSKDNPFYFSRMW